jgi:hypothetical protein
MATKYTKLWQNRANDRKMYHYLPLQVPPIFTKIGIFGLKIKHLATLVISSEMTFIMSENTSRSIKQRSSAVETTNIFL